MIIQCDKCKTKFKVDNSIIPDKGAKIRCKKCQHIFKVEKSQPDVVATQPKKDIVVTEGEKNLGETQEVPRPSETEHMGFWGTEPSLTGFEEDFISKESEEEGIREEGPVADSFHDEFIAKGAPDTTPGGRKRKLNLRNIGILAFFLLIVVGGGAYLLQTISSNRGTSREEGTIGISGLKGYYHDNKQAGRLFVIEGRLVNPWNFSIASGTVKGSIFDHNRNELQKRIAAPGNILTKKQLTELSTDGIEANLRTQSGRIVEAGKSLPFMIVFFNAPGDLSEFMVEVSE